MYDNLVASDYSTAEAVGVTLAFVAADVTGVRGVSDAFSQHDAVDGHDQSTYERWVDGVSGGITLVATAAGAYGTIKGAVGGLGQNARAATREAMEETAERLPKCDCGADPTCFVAGTPVLMAELATDHRSLSDAPPLDASPGLDSLLGATLVATITVGGVRLRLRRWTRRRRHRFAVDDFFRTLGSPDHPEEVPHASVITQPPGCQDGSAPPPT